MSIQRPYDGGEFATRQVHAAAVTGGPDGERAHRKVSGAEREAGFMERYA